MSKDAGIALATEVLYYAYDASGTPMAVTYTSASGTKTTYYYVTNLQGDVTAILTAGGTAVVQYTYDAWGNPLSITGSMASTLGKANSLRYRGYVYDNETALLIYSLMFSRAALLNKKRQISQRSLNPDVNYPGDVPYSLCKYEYIVCAVFPDGRIIIW